MKKRLLCGALALLLCLPSCGRLDPVEAPEQTEEVKTKTESGIPKVENPLTWEKIRAIPIATDDMTSDELRKICTDFMRLQLTFEWTPSKDLDYTLAVREKPMSFVRGRVYGGLPYRSGNANGNLYTVMEFYDPETGVLERGNYPSLDFAGIVGNDCASSPFWAWNRVVNSNRNFKDFETESGFTNTGLVPLNNLPSVGGYQLCSTETWDDGKGTRETCLQNGRQRIFQAYAALLPADGLIHFFPANGGVLPSANHLMMCSSKATVVYAEDGSIDGGKSFVTVLDQRSNLTTVRKETGSVHYEGGVDAVFTFDRLFDEYYLPFTFLEFLGQDPVEPAHAFLEGDTSSFGELQKATVKSNYAICHVRVTFTDEAGKERYSYLARPTLLNTRDFLLEKLLFSTSSFYADGKNTCRIDVFVGSGQEFTVFEGVLKK